MWQFVFVTIFGTPTPPLMASHRILYFTDGRDVAVTDSDFLVKNTSYPLSTIFDHKVSVILPRRTPFSVLIAMGALVFLCGSFDFLPSQISKSISIFGFAIVANALIMVVGISVMLLGMLVVFHSRDKYAVKVSTSHGVKTALISHRREYVKQITDALNHAHLDLMKGPPIEKGRFVR
jgi:hypothetical protein